MSTLSEILLIIFVSISLWNNGQGAPVLDELFNGLLREGQSANTPAKEGAIVKRRIYADNPDSELKQISLKALIDDVEKNLVNTALSVGSVAHDNEAKIEEVTPISIAVVDRTRIKREIVEKNIATNTESGFKNAPFTATTEATESTESTEATEASKNIWLQTTQKVPAAKGVPAHILIDRVAVQPHQGGLPFIPAFQVYQTKVISATFKEPHTGSDDGSSKSTKISFAQTALQATNSANAVPVLTIATSNQTINPSHSLVTPLVAAAAQPTITNILDTTKSTATTIHDIPTTSSTTTVVATETTPNTIKTAIPTTTTTATTTNKLPIEQLKEAEEELKEKVAEIEAEPIILTARV